MRQHENENYIAGGTSNASELLSIAGQCYPPSSNVRPYLFQLGGSKIGRLPCLTGLLLQSWFYMAPCSQDTERKQYSPQRFVRQPYEPPTWALLRPFRNKAVEPPIQKHFKWYQTNAHPLQSGVQDRCESLFEHRFLRHLWPRKERCIK